MKKKIPLAIAFFALIAGSAGSARAVYSFQGSDTLAGVIEDAILASGMSNELGYLGGGSGKGEDALVKGSQGIAPMSRDMKPDAIAAGKAKGVEFIDHVIALDGVGVFVNSANEVAGFDIPLLQKIFTCQVADWRDVPGSNRSGKINVYRRDDKSGTTDTFKNLVGISQFGDCVSVVAETSDISDKTGSDPFAIGYAGNSAKRDNNRAAKISKGNGAPYVELNVNTVRDFSYPLARKLHVFEASGATKPNAEEAKFLAKILDRAFLDPIVVKNEFYTLN
jgi:phosphate transport system substrate-binding protein